MKYKVNPVDRENSIPSFDESANFEPVKHSVKWNESVMVPCEVPTDADGCVGGEYDPNGIMAGAPGAKLDAGKIRLHLLKDFKLALMAVSDLATGGANKYSAGGWQHVENGVERYEDAAIGHWLRSGFETFDPDMKVSHFTQFVWNAMASLELRLRKDPVAVERLMARKATDRHGPARDIVI